YPSLEERAGGGVHHRAVDVDDLRERLLVGQRGLDGSVAAGREVAFEVLEAGDEAIVERVAQGVPVLEVDEDTDEETQHRRDQREDEGEAGPERPGAQPHASIRSR